MSKYVANLGAANVDSGKSVTHLLKYVKKLWSMFRLHFE